MLISQFNYLNLEKHLNLVSQSLRGPGSINAGIMRMLGLKSV